MDRLDRAVDRADLTGRAALAVPLQPFELTDLGRDRERRAERAEVAAERPLDEQPDPEQDERVDHERPGAVELQHDRGLERLDLGDADGERHRPERQREQAEEHDVFDRPQTLVDRERHAVLRHLEAPGGLVGKLLERAERTQPAAEHAAPPEQSATAT